MKRLPLKNKYLKDNTPENKTNYNQTRHITRAVCTLFEMTNKNKQSISNRIEKKT